MDAFAWPLAVLIFCGFFTLLFQGPIRGVIGRIQRVDRGGVSIGPAQQNQTRDVGSTSADEVLRQTFDNQLLLHGEDHYRALLQGVTEPPERERVLLRHLASMAWAWVFERIYFAIWGSQILALEFANTQRVTGGTEQQMRAIFDRAVSQFPEVHSASTFDAWYGFLRNMELIELTDERFVVTPAGREFLQYLVRQGYSSIAKSG